MPVLAASSTPTSSTARPKPPGSAPHSRLIASSRSSATRERCSVTPMNTNSGTAIRMSLVMMPKTRDGSVSSKAGSNTPASAAAPATKSETPASVNATG